MIVITVIETLLQTLQVFEANYPEILKTAWIINGTYTCVITVIIIDLDLGKMSPVEHIMTGFFLSCIPAPKVFQLFWAIIKPIMTPRTLAKIQIHGSDRVKWKRLIMEHVEPDSMPSEYGGSITTCPNVIMFVVSFMAATILCLLPC